MGEQRSGVPAFQHRRCAIAFGERSRYPAGVREQGRVGHPCFGDRQRPRRCRSPIRTASRRILIDSVGPAVWRTLRRQRTHRHDPRGRIGLRLLDEPASDRLREGRRDRHLAVHRFGTLLQLRQLRRRGDRHAAQRVRSRSSSSRSGASAPARSTTRLTLPAGMPSSREPARGRQPPPRGCRPTSARSPAPAPTGTS